MVGKTINQAKNLWIVIISMLLLLGVAVVIWILSSQPETEIPQKGVFVMCNEE